MTQRLLAAFGGFVLLASLFAGVGVLWLEQTMSRPLSDSNEPVTVEVKRDVTIAEAAEILMYYGLVEEPALWRLRALQRGLQGRVMAGRYQLNTDMTPDAILDKIVTVPDSPTGPMKLQIIPGDTIWRVRERLVALGIKEDLLELDRDTERLNAMSSKVPKKARKAYTRLEGYLAPDTYFIERDDPRLGPAVKNATRQFWRRWNAVVDQNRASYDRLRKAFGLKDRDFVTLASLVEKEVAYLPEAPMVAAVFYNRLRKGMKLQTDPTLVYAPSTWQETPRPKHRRDRTNPYNTYAHKGLPPGPICAPGPQALAAVLKPGMTRALFFVAMRDGTGRHAFSETLAEHEANIQRYLK